MTVNAAPRSTVAAPDRCSPTVTLDVIDEVDSYAKSIAGVEIQAVCNGRLEGPNTVLSVSDPRFTMTSSDVSMSLLSRTTVGDDNIVMSYIRSAGQGSRWCGFDLEAGSLILYGPSAEHTAVTQPGLDWTCAITDVDRLATIAEQLSMPIELPARGEVRVMRSPRSRGVGAALCALIEVASTQSSISDVPGDDVLRAMVRALREADRAHQHGGRHINSRVVTARSIEYADATGRVPSLSELCIAAHVSERTLRKAFVDEYQIPPARFFRTWALAEARRRLLDNDPTHHSVADVAAGLGFFHLGRFANYYKQLYGESPSTTLRVRGSGFPAAIPPED